MRRILKLLIKVDVRLVPCWSTKCRFSLLPNFSAAFIISQRSQTEREAGEKKPIVAELVVFLACSTACGTAATAQKKFLDTQREEEIASTAHTHKKNRLSNFFSFLLLSGEKKPTATLDGWIGPPQGRRGESSQSSQPP